MHLSAHRPLVASFVVSLLLAAACGSDEGSAAGPVASGGSAGGTAGGTAGGSGGFAAGGAGAGAAAGPTGGRAGTSGQAGSAGAAGSAGGACVVATDCPAALTAPAGCAEARCEVGKCLYRSRDADGDTHRTKTCASTATPAIVIELGDDCADADAAVFPGAWDGPAADGKPDRCGDGVDQDCSGVEGDGKGTKGESCTCTPGDVQPCAQDASGKPIDYPGGQPQGACSLGSRTCVVDAITKSAVYGPCTGAIAPSKEICNGGIDDDCDGAADMLDSDPPLNTATWSFDGDGDGYVTGTTAHLEWCTDERPSVCPPDKAGCDQLKWKLGNLPLGDCDDANEAARPDAIEKCADDGSGVPKDLDCNGFTSAPGAGDCACRDGDVVSCAPSDKSYPDTASRPSDKYPLAALDPQSGGLVGECRWGQKECVKGQWTGCHDGTGAKAAEDCSKTDKKDYDCNGIPNLNPDNSTTTDCKCVGSATQPCGVCGQGTSTCSGGVYGPCLGDDVQVTYCADGDGDSVCGGACQLECPGTNHAGRRLASTCFQGENTVDCNDKSGTVGQNVKESCSAIDEDCDGLANDGYDVGAACNNGKLGACYQTGKKVCANASSTKCDILFSVLPGDYGKTKLNGSWDRNCDGKEEHKPPITLIATFAPKATTLGALGLPSCSSYALTGSTNAAVYKACKTAFPTFPGGTARQTQVVLCSGGVPLTANMVVQPEAILAGSGFGEKTTTACGASFVQIICDPVIDQAGADIVVQQCR